MRHWQTDTFFFVVFPNEAHRLYTLLFILYTKTHIASITTKNKKLRTPFLCCCSLFKTKSKKQINNFVNVCLWGPPTKLHYLRVSKTTTHIEIGLPIIMRVTTRVKTDHHFDSIRPQTLCPCHLIRFVYIHIDTYSHI